MENEGEFQRNFEEILKEDYEFSEKEIQDYWEYRQYRDACVARRVTQIAGLAAAGIIGVAGIAVCASNPMEVTNAATTAGIITSSIIVGGSVALTIGSLVKNNPYKGNNTDIVKDVDQVYKLKCKSFKRDNK